MRKNWAYELSGFGRTEKKVVTYQMPWLTMVMPLLAGMAIAL